MGYIEIELKYIGHEPCFFPIEKPEHLEDLEYLEGIGELEYMIDFKNKQKVRVEWPDGTQTQETIYLETKYGTIHETGISANIKYKCPFIIPSRKDVESRLGEWDIDKLKYYIQDLHFKPVKKY